ncbi:MAG: indole-3-glycerol phosphate synthase TrpC [Calditrichaceae bacterium]|nr:indole-3-glycerol phosphate synthase TrpC [Calditrichaceae bacterium]HES59051.1 indole-3-glycerol phosphate synthase TrpC [Caldithrix sp.]
MTILDEIVTYKRGVVAEAKKSGSIEALKDQIDLSERPRSLLTKMSIDTGFHFICEVKKASPSKGIIQPNFNPTEQSKLYEQGGASAISVLTDEKYFMGSLEYLKAIKRTVQLPVLRKDFIIDAYQIYESRAAGADLILLITRILSKDQLNDFYQQAKELGLEALIEIADAEDIDKIPVLPDKAILGINNRNLHTFEVSLQNSIHIKPNLPAEVPVISESGIHNADDCKLLFNHGFRGALIGESLMRAGSPVELLQQMKTGVTYV